MRAIALAALILAGCGDGDSNSSPSSGAWEIGPVIDGRNYSIGLPRSTDGSFEIGPNAEPHYVTRGSGSLAGKSAITLRYRVEGPEGTAFTPCANITLHFQARNDDWKTEGYRWWATFASVPLTLGTHEITAPLDGNWTGTFTASAATNLDLFNDAKASAERVGFTFGNCTGYGHGARADRTVRFTIDSFEAV